MGGCSGGVRSGYCVTGHDQTTGVGEDSGRLLGDAFDPGADRRQAVPLAARWTFRWNNQGMAAMMAQKLAPGTVLDQPGGAVGALHPVAAMAAQRQRRIAAAVEEQHRLLP